MSATATDCLRAALEYAGLGLPVVPVMGKSRLPKGWPELATSDEEAVIALWESWGHGKANVGVKCGPHGQGGVVDLNANGPEGEDTFRLIFGEEAPITWTYRARRGPHWWFRWREGLPPAARFFIGGTLEVITGNAAAYTLAPPSEADGVRREWLPGLSPGECELAELSDAVVATLTNWRGMTAEDLQQQATTPKRPAEHWERIAAGVAEGTRNDDMASYIGKTLRETISLDDPATVAHAWRSIDAVNAKHKPPLKDGELRKVFESILGRERQRRLSEEMNTMITPEAAPLPLGAKPTPPAEWRAEIEDGDPPMYRLYAPQFAKAERGYLYLTGDQFQNGSKLRRQAQDQAREPLPKSFAKHWDSRKRDSNGQWQPSPYERLLRSAKVVEVPPERQRWRVVAEAVLGLLERARNLEANDKPDTKGRPCRMPDGSIMFKSSWLANELRWEGEKILRPEISLLFDRIGHEEPRVDGKRFWRLTEEHLGRLRAAAEGDNVPRRE